MKIALGRLRRFWPKTKHRRTRRYKIDWPIRYHRLRTSSAKGAKIRDLSQTGVGIILQEIFEPGSDIHLEFTPPGQQAPLTVTGQVIWTKEVYPVRKPFQDIRFYFVGIRFYDTQRETVAHLAAALEKK